jgi:hypothetical protein
MLMDTGHVQRRCVRFCVTVSPSGTLDAFEPLVWVMSDATWPWHSASAGTEA